jgi:AAHS family 4-hydroxybenzoate transporter-like MFS transporter
LTTVRNTPETPLVDVGTLLDEGRWSGYQQTLVALTALTIIFDGADNQLLATAVPMMMRDWSVARAAFAPVIAAGLTGMMFGGAIAGFFGDRIGRKAALIGSVLVFGFATGAAAAADGVTSLGILRFIAGLGLGGAVPNAAALASEFVPKRHRPLAVTLTIVCVPLGGTLAGLLALRVLPVFGWRVLFLLGGIIPVVTALALIRLLAESPRYLATRPERLPELVALLRRIGHTVSPAARFAESGGGTSGRVSVGSLLTPEYRQDTIALWCAFLSCLFAVYLGFNWIPAMLTGAGLPPSIGSTGITVFNLGGVAGAILGALAFARIGSRWTMLALALGAAASAAAMRDLTIGPAGSTTTLISMLGLTGGLINAVQTTMYALAAQVYPTTVRATGVGTAVAIGRSGAILSSYAGSLAIDAGGAPLFFLVIALAMVSAATALMFVTRHIPAQESRSGRR